MYDYTMTQAVNRLPPITEAQNNSQASPCWWRGAKVDTGRVFLQYFGTIPPVHNIRSSIAVVM
jgi:hypothetical protein